jgi:transcriptional regulator with XRE-family HTH domain
MYNEAELDTDAIKIGKRISFFKQQLNITNEQLAAMTGLSGKSSVDRVLNGKSCKGYAKLKMWARVLHTTPHRLLEWPEDLADCSEPLQAVLEGVYAAIGLPIPEARALAETVRAGLDSQGPESASMDRLDYLRARAEIATRLAVGSKTQLSQPG